MFKAARPDAIQLLHEGALALSWVESNGMRIDEDYLDRTITQTEKEIRELQEELKKTDVYRTWIKIYGEKTKLGSREQLGTIIFGGKVGRGGEFKGLGFERKEGVDNNDEHAFSHVNHPFVKDYVKIEKRKKGNTFLQGIQKEVVDGFLHPNFNLNIAMSYRSSGDMPNPQNWPVRDPIIAKLIRSAFIARDGHQMAENDFAGVEVRTIACYNKDPVMIKYIKSDYDYHKQFASKCFKVPIDKVTKIVRYTGKNMFVFPEFYGSYYANCARDMWDACERLNLKVDEIPMREWLRQNGINGLGTPGGGKPVKGTFEYHVQQIEEDLWKTFPVYAEWKEKWWEKYLRLGYIKTLTGFVLHGLLRRNQVINTSNQGTAFHCLLWVLIQLVKWLRKYRMKSKVVSQIHDSGIGDVHEKELQDYLAKVKELVEVDLPKHWDWIIVPMEIEAEISPPGGTWHDKKEVKL